MKKVKNNFRKALDSGRRSGSGRLVFTLHKDCSAIWSGCPSAESIAGGIETSSVNANDVSDIMDPSESDESLRNSSTSSSTLFETGDEALEPQDTDDDLQPTRKKMKEGRESLSDVLKDRRNSKSNKHISFQDQMLGISKFDLDLKKKMMNQFEESEKNINETITTFG